MSPDPPTGRPRLVKLVRDRVGQFIGADCRVDYRPVPTEHVIELLRAKLLEEAAEYLADPSVGELADVLEVVRALARWEWGYELEHVIVLADDKVAERGGFGEGVGMYVETTAPTKHEGSHA